MSKVFASWQSPLSTYTHTHTHTHIHIHTPTPTHPLQKIPVRTMVSWTLECRARFPNTEATAVNASVDSYCSVTLCRADKPLLLTKCEAWSGVWNGSRPSIEQWEEEMVSWRGTWGFYWLHLKPELPTLQWLSETKSNFQCNHRILSIMHMFW